MTEVDYEGRGVGNTFFSHICWCKIKPQPLTIYHQSIFINLILSQLDNVLQDLSQKQGQAG